MLIAGIYLAFSAIYAGLLLHIFRAWNRIGEAIQTHEAFDLKFSVIIPARNESTNIIQCIEAVQRCVYPKECYEIIVIDDHSTDDTAEKVRLFNLGNVHLYTLPKGVTGKKEAITFGVSKAQFDYILCTDADSLPEKAWMNSHAAVFYKKNAMMTTGLVIPNVEHSVLDHFQWMDFTATMAITAVGIQYQKWFLANGANFGFTKEFFIQSGGYEGNSHIASGDDIFLIEKASALDPGKIAFVKSQTGLVHTQPVKSWRDLMEQRKRWATKALKTKGTGVVVIQAFVFLSVLTIVSGITLGGIVDRHFILYALLGLGFKMFADGLFLKKMAQYYRQKFRWAYFIPSFFVYIVHILYSGWQALFPGSYHWKNRKIS